jgi:type IV secretion system protein VirB6
LLGKLILTFALAIGPLAILCLLFKSTARFFDSWLSFVLSAVVLSWFVFFALGMSCTSPRKLFLRLHDGSAFVAGVPGSVGALEAAGTYLAVMCLLAIVLYQAPSLASSLTGGASIQTGAQMISNAVVATRLGGRAGAAAAASGSGGSMGAAAASPMSPDGPQAVWGPLAERLRMVPAPHISASLSVAEFQREVSTAFSTREYIS